MTGLWRTKTVARSSAPTHSLPRPLNLSIRTCRTLTYSTGPMDATAVSVSFGTSNARPGWMDPTGSKSAQLTRRASTCQYRTPGRDLNNRPRYCSIPHLHAKSWPEHRDHMLWLVLFIRKERNDLPIGIEPPECARERSFGKDLVTGTHK
jgi:hypothetical protein